MTEIKLHPWRCETCGEKNTKKCPMIAEYRNNCISNGEHPKMRVIHKLMEYHNDTIKEHGCASHSDAHFSNDT